MGCPNLDGKVGQDCGEGPQSSAAHGPWPRHPGCPLGGVPVLRAGLCARGISSSPPWGRSIQGQGPSPGHPALTSAPPPAPAHPQTHAATQPPTHSPSCPVPPRPQARIWGPRGQGTGGHGCVADRFLASSARPWAGWGWAQDGPPGSPGLGGSLGRPCQGPWCPGSCSCPSGLLPPAHSPRGCALRLPTSRLVTPTFAGGSGISPDLSPP